MRRKSKLMTYPDKSLRSLYLPIPQNKQKNTYKHVHVIDHAPQAYLIKHFKECLGLFIANLFVYHILIRIFMLI